MWDILNILCHSHIITNKITNSGPRVKCFTSICTILNLSDLYKALRMSWASDKFGGRVTKNVKFASLWQED